MNRCLVSCLLQSEQAEDEGEECHGLNDTDDDEVVGGSLSCFSECITSIGGHFSLHPCRKTDGKTSEDSNTKSQG